MQRTGGRPVCLWLLCGSDFMVAGLWSDPPVQLR
jgi:hypothetical protein